MDKHRFDHAVRSLQEGAPRRQVLGVLLGGALGVAGLAESGAKKKKKKVTLCLNGQTKTVKKSKQASLLSQGATKGACPSSPPPPACPTSQKLCNGRCIDKANCCTDADCDKCKQLTCQSETCTCKPGTVPDAAGFCGPPAGAACQPTGQIVAAPALCCSQNNAAFIPPASFQCLPGGTFCKSPVDCGGGACRGFMCPGVYVGTVGEACANA